MDLPSKMTMEIFTKLEHQWLNHHTATRKPTRILTIDGGGTSAIVSGTFLTHLEYQIQSKTGDSSSRVSDFFDIIAGTGIGAVLAVLLTASGESSGGRPLFSAKEAVAFLEENSSEMFKVKRGGILRRRKGRRCSGDSLEGVLKSALSRGEKAMTLKDTCKPILIPCYDMKTASPFVFSRAAASASEWTSLDFELWKVCRAAMATPAVFEPFELTSVDGKTACLAVDGGLVMNNPAAAAVTHVLHNKVDFPLVNGVEDLLVLSLGNGTLRSSGKVSVDRNGECSTEFVVDVAIDGVSETVDQLLGNAFCLNRCDYVRIQANRLDGSGVMTMDEVLKEKGIESLTFGAKRLLSETNGERIEGFVQRLIAASNKSSLPPSPFKSLSPLLDGR